MNRILQSDWFREQAEFSDRQFGILRDEMNEPMKVLLSKINVVAHQPL